MNAQATMVKATCSPCLRGNHGQCTFPGNCAHVHWRCDEKPPAPVVPSVDEQQASGYPGRRARVISYLAEHSPFDGGTAELAAAMGEPVRLTSHAVSRLVRNGVVGREPEAKPGIGATKLWLVNASDWFVDRDG